MRRSFKNSTDRPARPARPARSHRDSSPSSTSAQSQNTSIRLNKALSQAGVCSRRAADEFIAAGRVMVNGLIALAGTKIIPGRDEVRLDGRPVSLDGGETHLTLMLNKPVETVTTASDPQGRRTVLDLVANVSGGRRLFPVGRLDYFSEGLLLLTTDGELANRLMHPRWHLPKLYRVTVRGEVREEALSAMRKGMTLAEGEKLAPVKAVMLRRGTAESVIELELVQGVNRQIRRMCRDLDLTILKLERIAQGPLRLGALSSGASRPLTPEELQALTRSVSLP